MSDKVFAIIAAAVVVVGLAVGGAYVLFAPTRDCGQGVIAGGDGAIGGPFTLVDHTGRTVTDAEVITGPSLLYFGFTYCPDVCPLDSARNAAAVDELDARGIAVTPVFISIDPERDTPEVLAEYVDLMHPRMIGLTGTREQVREASQAYRTYYRKNGEGSDYLMDHSTFTYLVTPDGFVDFFRRDVTPEQLADRVSCHLR